jgi:hypothetical protein
MKKPLKIFLISFTLLTFSNTAYGGFFGDIIKDIFGEPDESPFAEKRGGVDNVRCMVEYTKLDLITGAEKTIKITTQINILEFDIVSLMTQAIRNLADKITKLVNASKHNGS